MFKIIDRYIIKKFLTTYFFGLAMITVVIIIFDAAEKIDDFQSAHVSFGIIISEYYVNFLPYFVNQFSGLFTFITVILFTSKMAYDTEIIAILSSGVSFRRMMWPYFVSAALITIVSLLLNLIVIPSANEKRIAFETKYTKADKKRYDSYEQYIHRQIEDNTFVFIRNFDGIKYRAGYFVLESYDGGTIISSLEASNASFNPKTGSWTADKYLHRTYDSYGNQKLIKSKSKLDTVINLSALELSRTEDLVQTMNSFELDEFIEQQRSKGSDMVSIFEVEKYSRYAYPFATFILTLIGVSLSSRKSRGGTGVHMMIGFAFCFSYIVLMRFTGEFAKSGAMTPWLAIWLPNIIYFIIGVYLYRKAPK